jgi:hypothetical protein
MDPGRFLKSKAAGRPPFDYPEIQGPEVAGARSHRLNPGSIGNRRGRRR